MAMLTALQTINAVHRPNKFNPQPRLPGRSLF
jgi:hypothetical protein